MEKKGLKQEQKTSEQKTKQKPPPKKKTKKQTRALITFRKYPNIHATRNQYRVVGGG